ncbi:hypothetical protein IFM89_030326 [Coptis chinensis]|uniref:Uncharacterized protein n=1 Tax=Coptis chinensis TaxID=261450 RepID=A0A835IG69_9MAGN|nr:hypothetical protein IFM89_030326 [Coptis chinensis]
METPLSWGWTLATQISLCIALIIAFNIGGDGELENSTFNKNTMKRRASAAADVYFLSVRGGFRPLEQQTHLLKQMEKVAKIHDVEFVINISEFGQDDPLQMGIAHFPSLKVPWYTTNTSHGLGKRYFLKQIPLQAGKILDLIVVDTGSLQADLPKGNGIYTESEHLRWLTQTLEETDGDWRIVVGYDSLIACAELRDGKKINIVNKSIYNIYTKFGVNAYMSKQACANHYIREGSISHIGNLGPADEPFANGSVIVTREMHNGFFLHRVGLLEIVSYFINPASVVMSRSILQQQGKEFM